MTQSRKVQMFGVVALMTVLAAGLIVTAQAQPKPAGAASAAATTFKPAQSVHQMMEGQDKLMKEIKAGIMDKSLKDAMVSSWILAEVANANQYHNDNPEYRGLAAKMSEQCVELAKTLKKGDEKTAITQLNAIGQTCGACHDKFKKD